MSHSYDELRSLSDDELIKAHDDLAKSTLVASLTYLEELARRDAGKSNAFYVEVHEVDNGDDRS